MKLEGEALDTVESALRSIEGEITKASKLTDAELRERLQKNEGEPEQTDDTPL